MKGEFACWLTTVAAGAVGVLHLSAQPERMEQILGLRLPDIGRANLRRVCNLDDALVLRVSLGTVLVTPHGGPRLRQRLTQAIHEAGVPFMPPGEAPPVDIFMEAKGELEARILAALSRAASSDAIALLLAQSERWAKHGAPNSSDEPRSRRLRRLIDPPTMVIAGEPNAGKSTLLNALVGRNAAATSPIAGTTRDFVGAHVVIAGLACRVLDAPGFPCGLKDADPVGRSSGTDVFKPTSKPTLNSIDLAAIARAKREIAEADLVVALAAPDQAWPDIEHYNILRVRSKSDIAPADAKNLDGAPSISALTGDGLMEFAKVAREQLVPSGDMASERPWNFEGEPHGPRSIKDP